MLHVTGARKNDSEYSHVENPDEVGNKTVAVISGKQTVIYELG